jgi:hypothetical protein
LRLGFTPQEAESAEVIKQSLELEFADPSEVKALPVNEEVSKVVRLLMNARARREAMSYMDRGDYMMAKQVVSATIAASAPLFESDMAADVIEEQQELMELESSLDDRRRDGMTRKRMAYSSYLRRQSKK